MTKREAALILGLRESAGEERIKDAHRRIMVANHPDSGERQFVWGSLGVISCRKWGVGTPAVLGRHLS